MFSNRVTAATSLGRIRRYGDERRRLLSIVAMEYPYWFLQQSFGCSPNTITAAKVHRILFGRGGVPPANLKFQRQRVNPCILEELSDFFDSDDVSRASSCRSVVIDGEETPVRYWKDSIDSIIQQYCLEFPGGVKRSYIYTHLPPNFRSNTMLAGLCNICDEQGHGNFEKLVALVEDVGRKAGIDLKCVCVAVKEYQCYLKRKLSKQAERHSTCLELCMSHAFQTECPEPHPHHSVDAIKMYEVFNTLRGTIQSLSEDSSQVFLCEKLDEIKVAHTQYVGHLLRTKHQGEYYQFVLMHLKPGELVMIINYKMKLELGAHSRETQCDWYGKRGISLHGCLVVAQTSAADRCVKILELWSEDTKQDGWFTQSAMDIILRWTEKAFPGYRLHLFSGMYVLHYEELHVWLYCGICIIACERAVLCLLL